MRDRYLEDDDIYETSVQLDAIKMQLQMRSVSPTRHQELCDLECELLCQLEEQKRKYDLRVGRR